MRLTDLVSNLADATADHGLDKAWTADVSSNVYENQNLFAGVANFQAKWTPFPGHRASRCPKGTLGEIFKYIYEDQVYHCANFVQTGMLDIPIKLHRDFEGCGCAELEHTDLKKNAPYEDKWAKPGFTACAGKDKLFELDDIKPLIKDFCNGFADLGSRVGPGAKLLRTTKDVPFELEPLLAAEPPAEAVADIYIFAAYDHKACRIANVAWPSEDDCIANLETAMNASVSNGICTYECSLAHAKNGDWELDYCQNFHAPQGTKTTGGYTWAQCLRWGIVDDLEEGILGAVVREE